MGQTCSLRAAIDADCKAREYQIDDMVAFIKAHCVIEEGAYTPFYTFCSAYYSFLCTIKSYGYTRYDFPTQVHNILRLYEKVDPRVKNRGFTEGVEWKTYDCMTVWNVRVVTCPQSTLDVPNSVHKA